MAKPTGRAPYSYRNDPDVPDFDDAGPIAVMDGDCTACSWGARTIARLDKSERFRICTVQSPTGTALVHHYGLDPTDPETWLVLENGRAWSGMEAIIRIGEGLGGTGRSPPACACCHGRCANGSTAASPAIATASVVLTCAH